MRIVLRPRHALHLSRRHQFTHQNIAPSLYPLPTVVGELHLLLVELDAVAKDAEHGTRTHDIVVKALFLQRIVLRQTSFIDQIHRLLHRIADVLVIGSKRKEVMVDFLYVDLQTAIPQRFIAITRRAGNKIDTPQVIYANSKEL